MNLSKDSPHFLLFSLPIVSNIYLKNGIKFCLSLKLECDGFEVKFRSDFSDLSKEEEKVSGIRMEYFSVEFNYCFPHSKASTNFKNLECYGFVWI